ncbi:MAG: hypothetical protein V7K88_28690 [Nostoc sp.]|uniref:hypothetical protein n=1 Tax=Nostoc sp. TaxID=1180 RepID=UPI002FF53A8A
MKNSEVRSKAGDALPTLRIKPTRDNYEPRAYPSDTSEIQLFHSIGQKENFLFLLKALRSSTPPTISGDGVAQNRHRTFDLNV